MKNRPNDHRTVHRPCLALATLLIALGGTARIAPAQTASTLEPPPVSASAAAVESLGKTPEQEAYLKASLEERVRIAERIGEDGARRYAAERGWKPIADGTGPTMRHGFDQVYLGTDDTVHVLESKGGNSPLGRGYGYAQGSCEWAVKAAERTLLSPVASDAEREAARRILEAARQGKLKVHVIRTPHVLGRPRPPVVEKVTTSSARTAKLAETIIQGLKARGVQGMKATASSSTAATRAVAPSVRSGLATESAAMRSAGRGSVVPKQAGSAASRIGRVAGRVLLPVAVLADAGFRTASTIEVEQAYSSGSIDHVERRVLHARNWGGMAGGWALGIPSGHVGWSLGAACGTAICPGPGTVIGGVIGGLVGGAAGYIAGEEIVGRVAGFVARELGQPTAGVVPPG